METRKHPKLVITEDGALRCGSRLYVPKVKELRREIMYEAYHTPYSIHPGGTKMFRDFSKHCWWIGMKKDIADYIEHCLACQ